MALERINPEGLPKPRGYTQVVVAGGGRTVYVAGQVALDGDGNVVGGGDVVAQARRAHRNLVTALEAAGARPSHVAKVTVFVVGDVGKLRAALPDIRREFFGDGVPASTLVGVQALALPEFLVEVEAVAVLD